MYNRELFWACVIRLFLFGSILAMPACTMTGTGTFTQTP